jgi:SIT family siderophore-iron:H+ symporter-like MFS transporter
MSAQVPTPVLRHDGVPESESPNGEKARSLDGGDDQTDKDTEVEDGRSDVVIERKSKGVVEMEALAEKINTKYLILLYGGFAILAYVLSLSELLVLPRARQQLMTDQYTSADFLDVAVSRAFGQHSLRATVSTITAVFQAVSQPPIAKFADVFGRVNAYLACVALYVIGYIIVPSSQNIYAYAAGNSIYILGITGLFLLQNIIISDISSLRSRYLWTIFPSIPGAINVFVAPIIVDSFLARGLDNWVWGYAMCEFPNVQAGQN